MRCADGEPIFVERFDDFSGEDRLELLGVGVYLAKIAEHIAAAAHDFHLPLHRNISFSRFNRSATRSDLPFRRLAALRRFFLEGMDHPDMIAQLHCVNDPKGVARERQGYFQDTRAEPLQGLGYIGFATFGCDGERGRWFEPPRGTSRSPSAPPSPRRPAVFCGLPPFRQGVPPMP